MASIFFSLTALIALMSIATLIYKGPTRQAAAVAQWACPTGAIFQRKDNGVVDIDSTLCIGCRKCEAVCGFGAPQFNVELNIVQKRNMCVDELEVGRDPYCVAACMMRVLDVGPIGQIADGSYDAKAIGPNEPVLRQVRSIADQELTNPSIRFVRHSKGIVQEGQGSPRP